MRTARRAANPVQELLPTEIEGFDSLAERAPDMRWCWNHATDGVWRLLQPALWELTHNPCIVSIIGLSLRRDPKTRIDSSRTTRRAVQSAFQEVSEFPDAVSGKEILKSLGESPRRGFEASSHKTVMRMTSNDMRDRCGRYNRQENTQCQPRSRQRSRLFPWERP